jgi:hypothetical protein
MTTCTQKQEIAQLGWGYAYNLAAMYFIATGKFYCESHNKYLK